MACFTKLYGSVITACITWVPPEPNQHLGAAGPAALSAAGSTDSAADSAADTTGNTESAGSPSEHLWARDAHECAYACDRPEASQQHTVSSLSQMFMGVGQQAQQQTASVLGLGIAT